MTFFYSDKNRYKIATNFIALKTKNLFLFFVDMWLPPPQTKNGGVLIMERGVNNFFNDKNKNYGIII